MITGKLFTAVYALALAVPPALALGFGGGHGGNGHEHEEVSFLLELGKAFALEGVMILLLQPVLAARLKWIEHPFGQDMLIRFHRNMAILAVVLLTLHPVLVAAGENAWFILTSVNLPWYVWAGKIAFLLLVINAILSLGFKWIPLPFEKWRMAHDFIGPAVLVILMSHALVIGPDVHGTPLIWIFPALLVISAAIFIWHRILRPNALDKHLWTVAEVKRETRDVCSLTLVPPPGERYAHLPGQFHFITLKRGRGIAEEEHHFTISSAPNPNGAVTSTIKNVGDYTSTICVTKPGDSARVHGPFGRFTYVVHPEEKKLVFLAAGIGITPIMSMLRHMRNAGGALPSTLIYANPDEENILFRNEIDTMASNMYGFKAAHVLSKPGRDWTGETGHVDKELIEKYAAPFTPDTGWYICGPMDFMDSVLSSLESLGVPKRRMHREIFKFI